MWSERRGRDCIIEGHSEIRISLLQVMVFFCYLIQMGVSLQDFKHWKMGLHSPQAVDTLDCFF